MCPICPITPGACYAIAGLASHTLRSAFGSDLDDCGEELVECPEIEADLDVCVEVENTKPKFSLYNKNLRASSTINNTQSLTENTVVKRNSQSPTINAAGLKQLEKLRQIKRRTLEFSDASSSTAATSNESYLDGISTTTSKSKDSRTSKTPKNFRNNNSRKSLEEKQIFEESHIENIIGTYSPSADLDEQAAPLIIERFESRQAKIEMFELFNDRLFKDWSLPAVRLMTRVGSDGEDGSSKKNDKRDEINDSPCLKQIDTIYNLEVQQATDEVLILTGWFGDMQLTRGGKVSSRQRKLKVTLNCVQKTGAVYMQINSPSGAVLMEKWIGDGNDGSAEASEGHESWSLGGLLGF